MVATDRKACSILLVQTDNIRTEGDKIAPCTGKLFIWLRRRRQHSANLRDVFPSPVTIVSYYYKPPSLSSILASHLARNRRNWTRMGQEWDGNGTGFGQELDSQPLLNLPSEMHDGQIRSPSQGVVVAGSPVQSRSGRSR